MSMPEKVYCRLSNADGDGLNPAEYDTGGDNYLTVCEDPKTADDGEYIAEYQLVRVLKVSKTVAEPVYKFTTVANSG